jgi:quinoprotein glucose dehydrogenase
MKQIVLFLILMTVTIVPTLSAQEWSHYGGDAAGTRYSGLKQITAENVNQLRIVWEFHTGALNPTSELNKKAAFEATPILADGLLYLSSPYNQVFALHPGKGTEIWRYDPQINRSKSSSEVTSRGVSFWRNPAKQDAACNTRIFIGTLDARLIALDAKTGKPCADFGSQGQVDLTKDVNLRNTADYQVTSPPVIVKNLVIVGSSIGDNRAVDLERGIVRA